MTKPEWNSFDDLKAETLELRARIDAMAFRLVEMTDQRNRARDALETIAGLFECGACQVYESSCDKCGHEVRKRKCCVCLANDALKSLRETEAKP